MAVDICRRFVLHNEFIPPTHKIHNWDYFAFGYIDGISVANKNIFSNDRGDLECLWKDSIYTKAELVEQESSQVIYGFRSEDEPGREEVFWEDMGDGTSYPFLFFIMIQFEDAGRKNLFSLFQYRKDVEQKYEVPDRVKAITYLTMDNSNLILVLRSRRYEDGAKIVDNFHRKELFYQSDHDVWKVKYSFTIPAVDRNYLNSSKFDEVREQKLYRAYIYAMELTAGSIQPLYQELMEELKDELEIKPEELRKKISKQSVLGYNDELIILSDIPWSAFLKLYRDKSGILNHSNKKYQKLVSCLTTIIGFEQEPDLGRKDTFSDGWTETTDIQTAFFAFLQGRLVKFTEENKEHTECDSMFLSIYHLVNSLAKFEKDSISENMFLPSAFSVYLLIEILCEIFEDTALFDVDECYREYRMFLNGLNSYAQNPIRSDRQFTQVIELNVKTYNLPIKLNAFYNAFIFSVRDFLNVPGSSGEEHSYEFLTCPGVSLHMYVEELFEGKSLDKRLFLVNIPESQIYNLEQMMVMLCHEIGHFVGGQVRERGTRKTCLIKALACMMSQYYRGSIDLQMGGDDFWQEFELELFREIEKKYEEFYSSEIIEKIYARNEQATDKQHHEAAEKVAEYRQQRRDHSIVMKEALLSAAGRVIKGDENRLFRKMLYNSYMNKYQEAGNDKDNAERERKRVTKNIVEASKNLLQVGLENADSINIKNMIEALIYLCREGLSDIIAIMTLQLGMEQYMKIILKNAREQGQLKELLNQQISLVGIRISLVTACMVSEKKGRELGYGWEKNSVLPGDADMRTLIHNVQGFINHFMGKGCDKNSCEWHNQYAYDYCCDWKLLLEIRKYLLKCRESCAELITQKKDELERVREIFNVSKAETIESAMLQIENVIDGYRNQIQQKMGQIIENDNNCVEIL